MKKVELTVVSRAGSFCARDTGAPGPQGLDSDWLHTRAVRPADGIDRTPLFFLAPNGVDRSFRDISLDAPASQLFSGSLLAQPATCSM